MAKSVRDRVREIQGELVDGEVLPSRAREMLMTLTSLFGNALQEVTRTKAEFTVVLSGHLDTEQKANRAKIRAEMSPEFAAWEEARNVELLITELIRSLKTLLKSTEEEMRLSR